MKELIIPKNYRRIGLYVYCNKCKTYSRQADGRLIKSQKCNHPAEKQVYKLKIHMPASGSRCRTKSLNTRDIKEADKARIEFIQYLEQNNYISSFQVMENVSQNDMYLLVYQMERFIDYHKNGGHFEFEQTSTLEEKTIKDYHRHFGYFLNSISSIANLRNIRVDEVDSKHVNAYHLSISKNKPSPKTYNNKMSFLRHFFNHIIKYEGIDINNPFAKVPIKKVHYDPVSFTKDEFDKILASTTLSNGYDPKKKKNYYKNWLPAAFRLGLYSCLRLDELVHLRFSDIIGEHELLYMEVKNRKVNRLLNNYDGESMRIKRIPVIDDMQEVLNKECNYNDNVDTNKYVIAPEIARGTVKEAIGRGFTHFKRIAGIDDKKCFKDMRTTYISKMQAKYGDYGLTSLISDHTSKDILRKHYIAQIEAIRQTAGFKIFDN